MTDATVLPGPNVSYDTLVQVMDTVRVYQIPEPPFSKAELFPDIAIADAPHMNAATASAGIASAAMAPAISRWFRSST